MLGNPIRWPGGARCAVAISFDMDADSILHLEFPETARDRVSTLSWLQYGPEVAIPRILDTFRRLEMRQTFFVPGWCAERYPETIEAIVEGGHELGNHGYIHENPNSLSAEDERYWTQKTNQILERFSGERPVGWRAPLYNFSRNSADILASEGFLYDSSLMGDDLPYILDSSSGSLVEIPVDWARDDWPQYVNNHDFEYTMPTRSPRRGLEVFEDEFDVVWEVGGLLVTVWHPFVSGRLSRWWHIERMFERMRERGDVWFASVREIAEFVNEQVATGAYAPRRKSMPIYVNSVSVDRA